MCGGDECGGGLRWDQFILLGDHDEQGTRQNAPDEVDRIGDIGDRFDAFQHLRCRGDWPVRFEVRVLVHIFRQFHKAAARHHQREAGDALLDPAQDAAQNGAHTDAEVADPALIHLRTGLQVVHGAAQVDHGLHPGIAPGERVGLDIVHAAWPHTVSPILRVDGERDKAAPHQCLAEPTNIVDVLVSPGAVHEQHHRHRPLHFFRDRDNSRDALVVGRVVVETVPRADRIVVQRFHRGVQGQIAVVSIKGAAQGLRSIRRWRQRKTLLPVGVA